MEQKEKRANHDPETHTFLKAALRGELSPLRVPGRPGAQQLLKAEAVACVRTSVSQGDVGKRTISKALDHLGGMIP